MARLQPDNTERHRRIQWIITATYIVSTLFFKTFLVYSGRLSVCVLLYFKVKWRTPLIVSGL